MIKLTGMWCFHIRTCAHSVNAFSLLMTLSCSGCLKEECFGTNVKLLHMKHHVNDQTYWAVVLPHPDRHTLCQHIVLANNPVLFTLLKTRMFGTNIKSLDMEQNYIQNIIISTKWCETHVKSLHNEHYIYNIIISTNGTKSGEQTHLFVPLHRTINSVVS